MLLIRYAPDETLPDPSLGLRPWADIDSTFAWGGTPAGTAWREQCTAGHNYGYLHPNDAQNDAARGVLEAINALRWYRVYLVTEKLK